MQVAKMTHQVLFCATICLLAISSANCKPNIRIQVNNDNLRHPPYLLEAIKRVEALDQQQQQVAPSSASPASSASEFGDTLPGEEANEDVASEQKRANQLPARNSFNVVKEDSIEEVLHLEPDSVLPLSPETLFGAMSSAELSKLNEEASPPSDLIASADESGPNGSPNKKLADSLPVTSSHLKRPPQQSSVAELQAQSAPVGQPATGGAKSLISPSVSNEEDDDAAAVAADKRRLSLVAQAAATPPDTWAPNQVMNLNGQPNASHVPATVTRQYGGQTRTRVTLGGGYVRDKQTPLVAPSSSEYIDSKLKKPVAPLERNKQQQASGADEPQATSDDVGPDRVIEVPQRIVLVQDNNQQVDASNKAIVLVTMTQSNSNISSDEVQAKPKGKPDSRCPKVGALTLEHPNACDKYFLCEDGFILERTCPNGLMYGTRDMVKDYCVHRWQADCGEKSVPNPISSPGCRWQWGISSVQGSPKCSPDYFECRDGQYEVRKCSHGGQVYDDRTKSCQFAEKVGCSDAALGDFRCPPDDQGNTYWPFPRYFLNDRALIHCVDDKPAIIRCVDGERVDPEHLHCVPEKKTSPDGAAAAAGEPSGGGAVAGTGASKRERPANKKAAAASQ